MKTIKMTEFLNLCHNNRFAEAKNYLIEHGGIRAHDIIMSIWKAAEEGAYDFLAYMMDAYGADLSTNNLDTALIKSVYKSSENNLQCSRLLLQNGANPNAYFQQSVYSAIDHSNLPALKLLLREGASLCYQEGSDRQITPLEHAVNKREPEIAEFLEVYLALNINERCVCGWIPGKLCANNRNTNRPINSQI